MPGLDALLVPETPHWSPPAAPAPAPMPPPLSKPKSSARRRQSPMRIDQIAPCDADSDEMDVDNAEEDEGAAAGEGAGVGTLTAASGDAFLSGRYKPRRHPARSATLELRALRQDAAHLDSKMRSLSLKWHSALPDERVRLRALEAAKTRWAIAQSETVNRSLKDQLLQQQLFLAALQRRVTDSPLLEPSRSREIFEALHSPLELPDHLTLAERAERLNAQCELGVRVAPAALDRFTHKFVDRQSNRGSPLFAHTSIMADERFTFVSSLLVGRLPNTTLRVAVDATVRYFTTLPAEMIRRGVVAQAELTLLQELEGNRAYSRLHYRYGPHFVANSNTTRSIHVGSDRAVIVVDFADRDNVHPTRTRPGDLIRDSTLVMVLTQERDPATGASRVLLQRINAIRYNLPPQSPLLHDEVRATLPVLNGDLFMEVVCRHMMELQQQQHVQLTSGQ